MASRPIIPFSMQITMALLANDPKKANEVMAQAVGCAGQAVIEIANSFEAPDLSFVLVALQSTYNAMYASLDQPGKNIVDSLLKRTECITVNASALEKMFGDGGKKEQ